MTQCDMLSSAKSLYTNRPCGTALLSLFFFLHFFFVLDYNTGYNSLPCTGQVAKLRMRLALRLLLGRNAARVPLPVGASASVSKWRRHPLRRAPPISYGESVDVTFSSHPSVRHSRLTCRSPRPDRGTNQLRVRSCCSTDSCCSPWRRWPEELSCYGAAEANEGGPSTSSTRSTRQ